MMLAAMSMAAFSQNSGVTPEDCEYFTPIASQPDGQLISDLYRAGESGYYYAGAGERRKIDGNIGQIVLTDNGEIYIWEPCLSVTFRAWVKGTIDSEGNVTVKTPQLISGGPDAGYAQYHMNFIWTKSGINGHNSMERKTA